VDWFKATGEMILVPNKRRTAPLKGLWAHEKGGSFHDGRFATPWQ
jgi:hypothetical protein